MTSPDNILLYLHEDDEKQVRDIFARLAQRGFPAQQQTPHITITFAPEMGQGAIEMASELLPAVVPADFQRRGAVIFGTKSKQTIAWLLETTDELEVAARRISAANPAGRGDRWIPHLTMGLRIPKDIVPNYLQALHEETSTHFKTLRATRAAVWKPRLQQRVDLAPVKGHYAAR